MHHKIMIVGEAWGEREAQLGKPFVGPSGGVLNGMLRLAGIPREECYLTNVFNLHPRNNKLESLAGPKHEALEGWPPLGRKLHIRQVFADELDRLFREIEFTNPNVIIALGATPLWALCKLVGIKKYRGTPLMSFDGKRKIFPTYHPAAVMRQWTLRPIVIADLAKAKREAEFPNLVRPVRYIHLEPDLEDIADFYREYIVPAEAVACDIETKQGTITEVGFAPSPERALVIPFYSREPGNHSYWKTPTEELAAWRWVERICAEKPLIGQNFSYDIQWLWRKNHIACPEVADDTMILHHALYPEMEKSLGFLGSIYTNEPSWKFMRTDHATLKEED